MSRYTLAAVTAAAVMTFATAAQAGSSATSDSACGSSPYLAYNVPNGSIMGSRGVGPIRNVIDGVGEYMTHVIGSHGGINWISHASMHAPGTTGWPDYCSTPAKSGELQYGYPGPSQINLGGLYHYTYGPGAGAEAFHYIHGGCEGEAAMNWLWSSSSYYWAGSKQGSQGLYRIKNYSGNAMNYSLYQFRDVESSPSDGWSSNNGAVCSSFMAWTQWKTTGKRVNNHSYQQWQKVNAINALYNGVESACQSGTGFWTDFGAGITCFEGICDDMARQVANCMSRNACNTDSDGWKSIRDNTGYQAITISPDRMMGRYPHNNSNNSSIFAGKPAYNVYFNSPGNTYGCWF